MGIERVKKELEDGLTSLAAGSDGGPDAFAPEIADHALGALRHFTVEHDEADLTFGRVVRWLHPRPGNLAEIDECEV